MEIGSQEWYDQRTALFDRMPDDLWDRANVAAARWLAYGPDITIWDASINQCRAHHTDFTLHQIQQAFECARDDILGEDG